MKTRVCHGPSISTQQSFIFMTSDGRSRVSLLPTCIMILHNLHLSLASSLINYSMSPALALGKQLAMAAEAASFTCLRTELPIIRIGLSVDVQGNAIGYVSRRWYRCGFRTMLSPSFPKSPAAQEGQQPLMLCMLGRTVTANGSWLAVVGFCSRVWNCVSSWLSLASMATNKTHLSQIPLSLLEDEEQLNM